VWNGLKACAVIFVNVCERLGGCCLRCYHRVRPPPAADGELERGYWWESHASRRQREARNHVRKMLRGKKHLVALAAAAQEKLNKRYYRQFWAGVFGGRLEVSVTQVYDDNATFFYPERLYLGFTVSIWLQLLLIAVVVNFAQWGDAFVVFARNVGEQKRDVAMSGLGSGAGDDQNPLQLAIEIITNEFALLVSSYLSWLEAFFGEGLLVPFAVICGVFQIWYVCALWRGIFVRYKQRLLAMRRGEYFFHRLAFRESGASLYIGFQARRAAAPSASPSPPRRRTLSLALAAAPPRPHPHSEPSPPRASAPTALGRRP
jgi:hypothetical protein